MSAEEFADEPPYAVACRRVADPAAGGYPEPGRTGLPLAREHDEVCGHPAAPVALENEELAALAQAMRPGEPPRSTRTVAGLFQPGCFAGMVTVSRLRPLSRRRFSTLRPPGVAIRARNPWVRLRRRLLGW